MEQRNREHVRTKRAKKPKRKSAIYLVLFLFIMITIPAVTGCFYFALKYQSVQEEAKEAWNQLQIETLEGQGVIEYSEEEVQGLLEQTKKESSQMFLDSLKEQMSNGDGTTTMLRYFYPNDVVVPDAKKYFFFPISDTLKKHSYLEENFRLNEKQQLEYFENEQILSTKGIDVSKYQGKIDWAKVKADGVDYAFIRLGLRGYGSGALVLDETFTENVEGCMEAGIPVGVYFVTQAITEDEIAEEVEFVKESLLPYQGKITYPVAIDVEEVADESGRSKHLTREERTKLVISFCEKIKEANYSPMIYGNLKSFFIMMDIAQLEAYPKWFANYSESVYFPYQFDIWQYTAKGKVEGIKKEVDINVGFYRP